jgi:hypothetical protein
LNIIRAALCLDFSVYLQIKDPTNFDQEAFRKFVELAEPLSAQHEQLLSPIRDDALNSIENPRQKYEKILRNFIQTIESSSRVDSKSAMRSKP